MSISKFLICFLVVSLFQQLEVEASKGRHKKARKKGVSKFYTPFNPKDKMGISDIRRQVEEAKENYLNHILSLIGPVPRLEFEGKLRNKNAFQNSTSEALRPEKTLEQLKKLLTNFNFLCQPKQMPEHLFQVQGGWFELPVFGMGPFALKITSKTGKEVVTPYLSYHIVSEYLKIRSLITENKDANKRRELLLAINHTFTPEQMRGLNYLETRFRGIILGVETLLATYPKTINPFGRGDGQPLVSVNRTMPEQTQFLLSEMKKNPQAVEFLKLFFYYNLGNFITSSENKYVGGIVLSRYRLGSPVPSTKAGIVLSIPENVGASEREKTGKLSVLDIYFVARIIGTRIAQQDPILYEFIQEAFLNPYSPIYKIGVGGFLKEGEKEAAYDHLGKLLDATRNVTRAAERSN